MNSLTSNSDREKGSAVKISQEYLTLQDVQDDALCADIRRFCTMPALEDQLKFIKHMSQLYLKPTGVKENISQIFVKFAVEVYFHSKCRNSLQNAISRMLSSAPEALRKYILLTLSERLAKMVTEARNALYSSGLSEFGVIDSAVSILAAYMSNFSYGMEVIRCHIADVLNLLVASLKAYSDTLQVEHAASVREELHRCIHNVVRVLVVILQWWNGEKTKDLSNGLIEIVDLGTICPLLKPTACRLVCLEQLPLDVRNTCSLTLVAYTASLPSTEIWQQLLLLAAGRDLPGCFQEFSNASLLTRLCLCVGLLGSLTIPDLTLPATCLDGKETPLAVILAALLEFASRKPSDPILDLASARAIYQVLRIMEEVVTTSRIGSCLKHQMQNMPTSKLCMDEIKSGADGVINANSVKLSVEALTVNVMPCLLPLLWTELEHSMDSVRHTARGSFQSLFHITETLETNAGETRPATELRTALAALAPFRRARYLAVAAAVTARPAAGAALAAAVGAAPDALLAAAAGDDAAVRPHAAAAFEALLAAEAPPPAVLGAPGALAAPDAPDAPDALQRRQRWLRRWVQPLVERLAADCASPAPEVRSVLSKAVARWPVGAAALALRLVRAGDGARPARGPLRALLLCLCAARRHGAFDAAEDDGRLWRSAVSYDLLRRCCVHACDEVRLGTLALMAEAHRTTEAPSQGELQVARAALAQLAAAQAPSTRQRAAALLRRLLQRLRHSATPAARRRQRLPAATAAARLDFARWLARFALASLFPGANFGRRCFSLQVLHFMTEELEEMPSLLWESGNAKILLDVLRDPYEENKCSALLLLRKFPSKALDLEEENFVLSLMSVCQSLAQSTRSPDTTTAAYVLRLLVSSASEDSMWISIAQIKQKFSMDYTTIHKCCGYRKFLQFHIVHAFFLLLTKEVALGQTNIMSAAIHGPMHGTLLCLRLLLEDIDLQAVAENPDWQLLINQLIDICYDAVSVVEDVVNSASPEGHLPMDVQQFTECQENESEFLKSVREDVNKVTAQQLLLCAWRTVKETSLLLGSLVLHSPIVEGDEFGNSTLLNKKQLFTMGQHFMRLLSQVKHRGAFEQVFIGFSQLCSKLWSLGKRPVPKNVTGAALNELPTYWLDELLNIVSTQDEHSGEKLCLTRRSAGVPFLVQALLATEPSSVTRETSVYPRCMGVLLSLAGEKSNSHTCTHALNILRAVFRSSALVERSMPYIAHALQVAVEGCSNGVWSVRSAATLLFATLITRIFGVACARDHHRLRNTTGRLFFHQHPTLYDFLLAELTSDHLQMSTTAHQPVPVLLLLSRLYPSSLEGTNSNLQLGRFVAPVSACARRAAWQARALAARALAPLLAPGERAPLLARLLAAAAAADGAVCWTTRHGLLLQVLSLLQLFTTQSSAYDETLKQRISQWLSSSWWLLTLPSSKQTCFFVAEAYIQVLQELASSLIKRSSQERIHSAELFLSTSARDVLLNDDGNDVEINPSEHTMWENVRQAVICELGLLKEKLSSFPEPGRCLYEIRASQLLLTLTKVLIPLELPHLLVHTLLCHSTETMLVGLSFVLQSCGGAPLSLPFEEEHEEKGETNSYVSNHIMCILKGSDSLAELIANLLILPEEQLQVDCRLHCFKLLPYLPLLLPWLSTLLCPSHLPEVIIDSKSDHKELVLQWLLRKLERDSRRFGPAIIATLQVFFTTSKEADGIKVDITMGPSGLHCLCTTLESASSSECPVEMRYSVACLLSSSHMSHILLDPYENQRLDVLALCRLWTAALQLLHDDDIQVRQQASLLALYIPGSDTMPVTETRARELLVSFFAEAMCLQAPLLTAVTLTSWILQFCDVAKIAKNQNTTEELFDQSETNTFGEPTLLAEESSIALAELVMQRPNLVTDSLPADVREWLAERCWDISSEQVADGEQSDPEDHSQDVTMQWSSLGQLAQFVEQQLMVSTTPLTISAGANFMRALNLPTRVHNLGLRVSLLLGALQLPTASQLTPATPQLLMKQLVA